MWGEKPVKQGLLVWGIRVEKRPFPLQLPFAGENGTTLAMTIVEEPPSRECRLLSNDQRTVLLFVNRTAGSGRGRPVVDQLAAALAEKGYPTEIVSDFQTLRTQEAELLAAGQLRTVISAGGDGTFGAVLNATHPGTPLAVLPMGTENLLGRYLDRDCSVPGVVRLIDEGVVVPLDAAKAGERLFSMMLSAGFDAEVVRRVHGQRRGNITRFAYAEPILRSLTGYRFPRMRASWVADSGEEESTEVSWAFVMNLPRYAMQLPLAPHASGTDGKLDLCLMEHGAITSGVWYLWHVLRRKHGLLDSVTTTQSPRLRLEAIGDVEVPYQIDGDPGGVLPIEIEAVPARMQLVVDRAVAERLGFQPPARSD